MKGKESSFSIIIMRNNKILFIAVTLLFPLLTGIARLEDLDKSPIGAYKGQILFGATLAFGFPFGALVNSEEDFADGTVYTFQEAEVTKTVALNHFSSSFSLFGEYVFRDHFGARVLLARNTIVQRSAFGKDLNNQNKVLFSDFSVALAPVYHLTVRKKYDVAFAPFAGLSVGTLNEAPVVAALFDEVGQKKAEQAAFVYGLDVSGIYYFASGFFITGGINLSFRSLKTDSFSRLTPLPEAEYNGDNDNALLGNVLVYFGGGYALYN